VEKAVGAVEKLGEKSWKSRPLAEKGDRCFLWKNPSTKLRASPFEKFKGTPEFLIGDRPWLSK
jgi:hypothetical protein